MIAKEIDGYERVMEFIIDTLYEQKDIISHAVPYAENYKTVCDSMYIIGKCTDILYRLNNYEIYKHEFTESDHELYDLLRSDEATDKLEKIKELQANSDKEDKYGWEYKVPNDEMVFCVKDIMGGKMKLQTMGDLVHLKWFPGYKYYKLRWGYN